MLERLEQQTRVTLNQGKIIIAAILFPDRLCSGIYCS